MLVLRSERNGRFAIGDRGLQVSVRAVFPGSCILHATGPGGRGMIELQNAGWVKVGPGWIGWSGNRGQGGIRLAFDYPKEIAIERLTIDRTPARKVGAA